MWKIKLHNKKLIRRNRTMRELMKELLKKSNESIGIIQETDNLIENIGS